MKKACIVLLCLGIIVTGVLLSGCSVKSSKQTINYQRRLQNYLPSNSAGQSTTSKMPTSIIDLSEGPRIQYDAHLGPHELDFDVRIKNPY